MGLLQSKALATCSCVDIALAVTNMGAAYEDYAMEVVAQNIDGAKLDSLREEDMSLVLERWGVNNRLHRLVLEKRLLHLKETQQGDYQEKQLSKQEWRRQILAKAQIEYAREKREYEILSAFQVVLQSKVEVLSRQCGATHSITPHCRHL